MNREEYEQQLAELKDLLDRNLMSEGVYETAVSAILEKMQGTPTVGARGIGVGGDVGKNAITGDHNRIIETDQYVENMVVQDGDEDKQENAQIRYLKKLIQRWNVLPLAAMGGEEGIGKAIGLDQVYIDLNTQTKVEIVKKNKKSESIDYWARNNDRPITAIEAVGQDKQIVLLGKPGSGKSSFLRQLTVNFAEGMLSQNKMAMGLPVRLPLLMNLRELTQYLDKVSLAGKGNEESQALLLVAVWKYWENLLHQYKADSLLEKLEDELTVGKVQLLLDGLDEVPKASREKVRLVIAALLREYGSDTPMIVTCRIRSYIGLAQIPGFTVHTLAQFNDEKIRQFVEAWYTTQCQLERFSKEEAKTKGLDLAKVATSNNLRELAANPMLLTTMAIIHQRDVGLPNERVRLYKLAVEVLLYRWQERKGSNISEELANKLKDTHLMRSILDQLGYAAHQLQETAGSGADLSRKDVLTVLEKNANLWPSKLADEFLDYVDLRAGLLVGQGGSEADDQPMTYGFPHRTFQEYLAGCALVTGRDFVDQYYEHMQSSDYWYLAGELGSEELLFNNSQGETTFLDLAYGLCPVQKPQSEKDWRGVVWSARMATLIDRERIISDTKKDGGKAYWERLVPRVKEAIRQDKILNSEERAGGARSLALLGDPREEVVSNEMLQFCYVPAGSFLMGSGDEVEEADDEEKKQHEVHIPYGYWLGQYPVTVAQFEQFVGDGGYTNSAYWPEAIQEDYWSKAGFKGRLDDAYRTQPHQYDWPFHLANHPVVGISWYEGMAFCRWLTERWRTQLPEGCHITLPSEAEWEKGARGGLQIVEKPSIHSLSEINVVHPNATLIDNSHPTRTYPWGESETSDQWETNWVNSEEGNIASSNGVGIFPRNLSPYGCEEMVGNVLEWTRSVYSSYPYNPADGREQYQTSKNNMILRGGAFLVNKSWARCAFRNWYVPDSRNDYVGFRLVCVPISLDSDPLRMQGNL